jgi:hypothetical protein
MLDLIKAVSLLHMSKAGEPEIFRPEVFRPEVFKPEVFRPAECLYE